MNKPTGKPFTQSFKPQGTQAPHYQETAMAPVSRATNPDKLGALWQKEDKNGNTYFSGTINDIKITVFANGFKTEDKHPDFIIMRAKERA